MDVSKTSLEGASKMESQQTQPLTAAPPDRKQQRLTYALAALVAAALVVLVLVWLVTRGGNNAATLPAVGTPAAVSEAQLFELAKTTNHPIYWAGSKKGAYELTRLADGRVYIRYLPNADAVGARAPKYLTIGTYPTRRAFRAIRRAAARPGAVSLKINHNGLLVFNQATPKSVYFGYPASTYQVEVYDPSPQAARTLVLGGHIIPIG
jgi:hypothetical protein